ncbi:dihydroorotase [Croceitalea sp. MTPC9]|uniref:dihydroorotase n=1 Tax=unclassified Croceitalea TaxID=2632280 RepID=UPI002B36A81E|nr:dihydroorotase [Croceitalea sp. MTPC6]GMN15839.1 dihydroorotase [Croceitalea sp. MTPC9]
MNILLKSATIIDSTNTTIHQKKRDILIKNGTIEKIAVKIDASKGVKEIALDKLHVSLGWFDSSVSFGEPGFEERETISNGLEVAAKSGFTDIVLNPNTKPTPDTSSDIIFLKERSKGFATNLYPIGNLTVNAGGGHLAELFDMHNAGAIAFYDYKKPIEDTNLLKIAMLYAQNFDGLVFSYPEEKKIKGKGTVNESEVSTRLGLKGIPSLSEELQIIRDLYILEYTGGKLHIPTVSTAKSVKLIAEAKKKGLDITASVAIHNLIFTDAELDSFDSDYKVKPPLRSEKDAKALQKGLQNGTIDFVTTDHTPIDIEQKRVEFDNAEFGTIGLESAFGALNTIFSLEETVTLLTKGRNRFGITSPKIKEGETACLTLFTPDEDYTFKKENISSTSKNSLFTGEQLKGKVYGVVNNGKTILN